MISENISLDSMESRLENSSSCFQISATRLRYVISCTSLNTLFEMSIITIWIFYRCDKLVAIYMNFMECFFFLKSKDVAGT